MLNNIDAKTRKEVLSCFLWGIKMKWIDSHIHVDQYKDEEKSRLLKEMENSKEIKGLIAVSMNYQSCKETLSLAKKYPFIYPAIGFHRATDS